MDNFDFFPKISRDIRQKIGLAKCRLGGVSYTAEWQLGSVRYTGEAIAKQMKSATALNRTILQKTTQNFTLLSHSMMKRNELKICQSVRR